MIRELKPSPLQLYARSTIPKFLRESEEDMKAPEPRLALGRVAKKDWANNRVLDRLMMYERRIESSMFRTMNKLKQLQVMRRMEKPAEEEMPAEILATTNPRACLKKQTQFASAMEDAKAYTRKDYDDKSRPGPGGKQSQTKPIHVPAKEQNRNSASDVCGRSAEERRKTISGVSSLTG